MPSPLPPLKLPETPRLSFLGSPKIAEPSSPGGRPIVPWIVQLEAEFDPILGEGQWKYIHFPQEIPFDEYPPFERFCKQHLPVLPDQFSYLMDYLHNFHTLNFDLRNGEVYPVIPRPSGFNVPIPLAGAPGNYNES